MSASTIYTKCPYCEQVINAIALTGHVTRKHPIVAMLRSAS